VPIHRDVLPDSALHHSNVQNRIAFAVILIAYRKDMSCMIAHRFIIVGVQTIPQTEIQSHSEIYAASKDLLKMNMPPFVRTVL
jgi:hypothetical protein